MPYHENHFLGEIYAEFFKREPPDKPFLGYTRDIETVATNNTIRQIMTDKSFVVPFPDKYCQCGATCKFEDIYCRFCGVKL